MDEDIEQSAQELDTPDHTPDPGEVDQQQDAHDGDPGDGDEGGEQPPVDDAEDVEFEGETFRLPKKLKDALLRQADYTQKTQEVADQRRQLQAENERIAQVQRGLVEQAQRQQQSFQAHAQVAAIDQTLQQYQGVNWQQLAQQDPAAAQQHWMQFQQLKDQRGQLVQQISHHEQQTALQTQQETARRMQEGQQVLAREIKDWSPAKATELFEYGKSLGIDEARLQQISDPKLVILLHKARQFDAIAAKAKDKPRAPVPPAAPIKTVKSGSGAATNPNDMTMEQWVEWDRKRQAKRNKP